MKILLINQNFYPDISATAQYLTDLARFLVEQGHDVTVLASRSGYLRSREGYPAEEVWNGVKIIRVPTLKLITRSILYRIIQALSLNLAFLFRLIRMPRFDSIIVLTSPPLVAFVAAVFAKKPKRSFIYWVMDLNPDQVFTAGIVKKNSLLGKFLEWTLRVVLDRVTKVIALDKYMAERLATRSESKNKIEVIPLWAHPDLAPVPRRENRFLREHKLEECFVVMYSGNMSLCHPISIVLNAAAELKDDNTIRFLFVGGGLRLSEVIDFKSINKLQNIIYVPYVSQEDLSHSLSSANLQLVTLGKEYIGIVHPSKLYGIRAVGVPYVVIGSLKENIYESTVNSKVGFRIESDDTNGLIELIRSLKEAKYGDSFESKTELEKDRKTRLNRICDLLEG